MTRIIGLVLASSLTTVSAIGITTLIAYDFLGEDGLKMVWAEVTAGLSGLVAAASPNTAFRPAKEITFFETVPVAGTKVNVKTGGAYASIEAVLEGNASHQWCYLSVPSVEPGIEATITLGQQVGDGAPTMLGADAAAGIDLALHGVAPSALPDIAISHCRLGRLDPLG